MKTIRIAVSWIFAAACAGLIFWFSSQSGEASAQMSTQVMHPFARLLAALFGEAAHTVLRKCAHFILYCALMFLVYNACFQARDKGRLSPVLPFALSVLYAVSDEIHQFFVPGRACRLYDIGVDALGCAVGGLCFWAAAKLCLIICRKHPKKSAAHTEDK